MDYTKKEKVKYKFIIIMLLNAKTVSLEKLQGKIQQHCHQEVANPTPHIIFNFFQLFSSDLSNCSSNPF